MSHSYVIRPKLDKSGGEEKVSYYAVPVVNNQIGTLKLAEKISKQSTFTSADITGAVLIIGDLILEEISDGNSVHLEGLGTFYLSAGSEPVSHPLDCTPGKVKANRLCFKACPKVRKEIRKIKFIQKQMDVKK